MHCVHALSRDTASTSGQRDWTHRPHQLLNTNYTDSVLQKPLFLLNLTVAPFPYGVMPAKTHDTVCRFRRNQISFAHGLTPLHISPLYADRSKLLCTLRGQTDADVDVPLALSVHELQAWKACVRATAAPNRAGPAPLQAFHDDTLFSALMVWSELAEACQCVHRIGLRCRLSAIPSLTIHVSVVKFT